MDRDRHISLLAELFAHCPDWDEQTRRLAVLGTISKGAVRQSLDAALRFTRPNADAYEFAIDGDVDPLLAIRGFRQLLRHLDEPRYSSIVADLLFQLGTAHKLIENEPNARLALESALRLLRTEADAARLLSCLLYLGDTYALLGKPQAAIDRFEEALSLPPDLGTGDDRSQVRIGLGLIYLGMDEPGQSDRLIAAIALFETASRFYEANGPEEQWAYAQSSLGFCFSDAQFGERADNLETAIGHFRNALGIYDRKDFPEDWARVSVGLGIALRDRVHGDALENTAAAVAMLKSTLRVYRRDTHADERAKVLVTLGALYVEGSFSDPSDTPERAIRILREALSLISVEDDPDTWSSANLNLGNAYSTRTKGHRRRNLSKAKEYLSVAAESCPRESVMLSGYINVSLGAVFIDQHCDIGLPTLDLAIAASRAALRVFHKDDVPDHWMRAQSNLAIAHICGDRWNDVSDVAEQVLDASDDLLKSASSTEESTRLVKAITETTDLGVLAKVQRGTSEDAFDFACRSRARFLRFMAGGALRSDGLSDFDQLRENKIFIQFALPTIDEMGLAFVATKTGVTAIKLEAFGYNEQRRLVREWLSAQRGTALGSGGNLENLRTVLTEVLSALNEQLSPVLRHIQSSNPDRLIFAPSGLLALLPLHAVSLPSEPRRCLLDEYEIICAPDLCIYLAKREVSQRPDPSLLIVSDPEMALAHASDERAAIADQLPKHKALVGTQANLQTVENALSGEFDIIHFTCHGAYGWSHFDDGGLKLAKSETLTFRSIIDNVKLRPGAIVVLAACESGVTDFETMSNETFGLQLAFLHAGAKAVISALWPVDDRATSLLMRSLYEGLKQGLAPAEALRRAQILLRDATNLKLFGDVLESERKSGFRISNQDGVAQSGSPAHPAEKSFADPVYWAGFTVYGG